MKHKRKISFSVISIVLSFLMCMYMLPTSVFADAAGLFSKIDELEQTTSTENSKDETVFEVTELREENVKHFRLENGQYYLASYPKAVHYLDENGKWQDIDNTISDNGSDLSTFDAKIKFAKKITGNSTLFTIHNGNMKIELSLDGAKKGTVGQIVENELKNKEYDETTLEGKLNKLTELENLKGEVIYEDILENIDVQYILESNHIKENIIVKEKGGEYVYTYTVNLNNMTAVLSDNGDVLLCDNQGNTVYTIPAPVVYDADNNYADNAWFTLEEISNEKYSLSVHVDNEWMENAAYPVVVDPEIVEGTENELDIEDGNLRYADFTASDDSIDINYYAHCVFNIKSVPELPVGSSVVDACLSYIVKSTTPNIAGEIFYLKSFTGVDFSNIQRLSSGSIGRMYSYFEFSEYSNSFLSFDVTQIYRDIYDGKSDAPTQFLIGTSGHADVIVYSQESDSSTKPFLTLKYINTTGVVDCYTYDTLNLGYAGTGYMAHNSSQLTLTRQDISTTNASSPFSVGYVYNSQNSNTVFDPKNTNGNSIYAMNVGLGGKLSVQQVITKIDDLTYEYIDADGTINYMYLSDWEVNSDGAYINRKYTSSFCQGIALVTDVTLSKYTSDYEVFSLHQYDRLYSTILEYDNGAMLLFYHGIPALYVDASGNITEYEYATSFSATTYGKPAESGNILFAINQYNKTSTGYTSVVDSISFGYDTNGKVKTITCGLDSVEYIYTYKAKFLSYNLTSVTVKTKTTETASWNSTSTARYSYSISNNRDYMSSVVDEVTDIGVMFGYQNGRYVSYSEANFATSEIQYSSKYTVSQSDNTTEVTYLGSDITSENDNVITVYNFDNYGRTVNVYTKDASGKVYGISNGEYVSDGGDNENLIQSSSVLGMPSVNLIKNPSIEEMPTSLPLSGSVWNANAITSVENFSATSEEVRSGKSSIKINIPNKAKYDWYIYQNVTVDETAEYCFSAYVYIDGVGAIGEGGGAYVKAANVLEAGGLRATSSMLIDRLEASTEGKSSLRDNWQRISVNFQGEAGKTYKLIIGSKYLWGKMYIDDVQLEKSNTPGKFSSVGWEGNTTLENPETYLDKSYIQLSSSLNELTEVTSNEFVIYPANNRSNYTLSAWAKAQSVRGVNSSFGIYYEVVYNKSEIKRVDENGNPQLDKDGNEIYDVISPSLRCGYIPFNSDIEDWQFVSVDIVPNILLDWDKTELSVEKIIVEFVYSCNYNVAKFTNLSIIENGVNRYSYNEEGSITSSSSGSNQADEYEYDEYDRLIGYVNEDSMYVTLDYGNDENNKKPLSTTVNGVTTSYTYDSAGNVTSVETSAEVGGNVLSMFTSSSYNDAMTKLLSRVDETGLETVYNYNSNGTVSNQVVDGVNTNYQYDKLYNMTKVWINNQAQVQYSYLNGTLSKITAGLTGETLEYTFTYDSFDRVTKISVAGQTLAKYEYVENSGLLSKMTYGESLYTISYSYDIFGRVTEIYHGVNLAYSYEYHTNGGVYTLVDYENGLEYVYEYDVFDRATSCKVYNVTTGAYVEGSRCGYDKNGRIKWESAYYSEIPATFTNVYSYSSEDGTLTGYEQSRGDLQFSYSYDSFDRMTTEVLKNYASYGTEYLSTPLTRSYTYALLSDNRTTNRIAAISYSGRSNASFEYTYTADGNIASVTYGGKTTSYEYDDLGQLIRENNKEAGETYVYEYDSRGNILSRKTYVYTTTTPGSLLDEQLYYYSGDKLTYFDGNYRTYDEVGNPENYERIAEDGTYHCLYFTWEKGRQLASTSINGTVYNYTYDADGIRTSKTVGNTTYKYYTSGGQLKAMEIIVNNTRTEMQFYYNASGIPVAFKYGNTLYYYLTNLQGDVVGIINDYGVCATYTYDAWGNIVDTFSVSSADSTLLNVNPLRYRGYIYDNETGFYYLQSRYYDPEVGRFINADGQLNGGFIGNNMYAYCNNNPVMYSDYSGDESVVAAMLYKGFIGGISGAVSGALVNMVLYPVNNESFTLRSFIADALGGAVSGGISGFGTGFLSLSKLGGPVTFTPVSIACGGLGSFVGSLITNGLKGTTNFWEEVLSDTIWGCIGGAISGFMSSPGLGSSSTTEIVKIFREPIKQIAKKFAKEVGQGILEEALSGFTYWYMELGVESFIDKIKDTFSGGAEN